MSENNHKVWCAANDWNGSKPCNCPARSELAAATGTDAITELNQASEPSAIAPVRVQPVVSHVACISELMDDITALRNTVLYLENRILRKEIAIQEILSGKECREDQLCTPQISAPPVVREPEATKGPTVKAMQRKVAKRGSK